ncbi:MAG: Uncharacterized protein G01um101493_134, partial [Microgenomates group bacterium Gr01-1014_93]
ALPIWIDLNKQKETLLSFPWMSRLSFLHFPKIETLEKNILVKALSFAGASELEGEVNLVTAPLESVSKVRSLPVTKLPEEETPTADEDFGFIEGDINKAEKLEVEEEKAEEEIEDRKFDENFIEATETDLVMPPKQESIVSPQEKPPSLNKFKNKKIIIPLGLILVFILSVLLLFKANVTIYAQPQVLEKDAQVTADPSAKVVNEDKKVIPGEIVEVTVNRTDKGTASGQKKVGDQAKGTVKVINNSANAQTLSQGTTITSGGLRFTLDSTVNIASTSATSDSKSTSTVKATAVEVGPDSNLPSGSQFSVSSNSQVAIVAEGNFSGGTSKTVTVVTDEDQKKLLAVLASNLRKQAKDQIQAKLKEKKILEEALSEEITKKSYSKNIGDQAQDFSLNLTIKYKGTAYSDNDLKAIVSKALSSQIPSDFELNLAQTETSADVSKLEKDGKLIFLARFKAKLTPKLDVNKLKGEIRAKTPAAAADILKKEPHIIGVDIRLTPPIPIQFSLLPILNRNINIEVKLQ